MKIKLNDQVQVITGKDKGKKGKVIKVLCKQNKVVVEKINIRTKHIKKTAERAGEKIQFEAPVDASNVMVVCPDSGKRTRVGYKKDATGKKERYAKISGAPLDTNVKTKK
jgi:large subunit ribosomal protein L24